MDKKQIIKFQIIITIFIFIFGTILHFTYEWSGENTIVGLFSATNESTWEHLKLLFFPMIITTIVGYFYVGRNILNYFCAESKGIIIALTFIVVFFYTYTGVIGRNFAFLDIGSFFVAVILGKYISYKNYFSKVKCNKKVAIGLLILLGIMFIIFTYFPPNIGLFISPV